MVPKIYLSTIYLSLVNILQELSYLRDGTICVGYWTGQGTVEAGLKSFSGGGHLKSNMEPWESCWGMGQDKWRDGTGSTTISIWHFLQQQPPMWLVMTGHIHIHISKMTSQGVVCDRSHTSKITSQLAVCPTTHHPLTGHKLLLDQSFY